MKKFYTIAIFALAICHTYPASSSEQQTEVRKILDEDVQFLKNFGKDDQLAILLKYQDAGMFDPAIDPNEVRLEIFDWIRENMPHVDTTLMEDFEEASTSRHVSLEEENPLGQRFQKFSTRYAARVQKFFNEEE